jgi:hypothetical protein
MLSGEGARGDPCWVEYSCSTFDLDTSRETVPGARTLPQVAERVRCRTAAFRNHQV